MSPTTLKELFVEFKKKGILKGDVAKKIGITDTYLSKVINGEKPITDSFKSGLAKYYGKDLKEVGADLNSIKNTTTIHGQDDEGQKGQLTMTEEPILEYKQPIIQVVLNLSYIGKKNADSMDKMADSVKEVTSGINKMAATNQRNTEIIAALVSTMLPNSKLDPKLRALLEALYKDQNRPVEDFLKGRESSPDPQKSDKGFSKGS